MSNDFRALVLREGSDGKVQAGIEQLNRDHLPPGDVLVRVEYSTLNYKDGMIVDGNKGRLVRRFPHIPGIDFAGIVESSTDARYKPGDAVILTGWRVGEIHWGGYAELARVKADWLVPLPKGMNAEHAMAIGTAGLTAMLCVMALEENGLQADNGPVLVTGAAGGVGSLAVAILSSRGYEVTAATGRPEEGAYLKQLGARQILERTALSEAADRPLESESWNHAVDSVGGATLSRLLGQLKYGTSVAACGLAGGSDLKATVLPFLLRGVRLVGIDSVMQPYEARIRAWDRLAHDLPRDSLDAAMRRCTLDELPEMAKTILAGRVRGRMVVDLSA